MLPSHSNSSLFLNLHPILAPVEQYLLNDLMPGSVLDESITGKKITVPLNSPNGYNTVIYTMFETYWTILLCSKFMLKFQSFASTIHLPTTLT